MKITRVPFVLIAVFSLAIVFGGCDNLVGSDGNDNGDEENDNTGNPGVTAPGVAEFSITGDVEETVEDGAAYFELVDMTELPSPADYRFDLQIADSWPFGLDTIFVDLSYSVDDSEFFPEEGDEYDVKLAASSDQWSGNLVLGSDDDGMILDESFDSTLKIDSASSDLIEGSFEIYFIYPDDSGQAVAEGTFSAEPAPD